MNIQLIYDSIPLYAQAAILTLRVGIAGVILSLICGLVCAGLVQLHLPILTPLIHAYIELSRNTPLIVDLVFLYYGLPKAGITLDSETCAILGLVFLGGSYMAEAFRSGFESVASQQVESGLALGMRASQVLRYVLLPQALAVSIPALTANTIFLIKEVSVVGVIALPDLVYVTKEQIGNTYDTPEAMVLLVSAYLLILLPISLLARVLEKRSRHAIFSN